MIINTEAIVLNSKKFGDTSKIVSLYTKEAGSISVIAKGARKPNSKFGSSLEALSYSQTSIYFSPHSSLHLLSKSEIHRPLRHIQESYDHLSAGLMIVESIIQSQETNEPNPELFSMLADSVVLLNGLPDNPFSLFALFQERLAQIMGFELNFGDTYRLAEDYINSGREIIISLEDASLNSPEAADRRNIYRMSPKALLSLAQLSGLELNESGQVEIDEASRVKIAGFFSQYFSYHLDKKFVYRSFNLLDR
jgi:DNA repair protein RecO (recombination protein O)